MTGIFIVDICIAATAIAGGLTVFWKLFKLMKRLGDFFDDWHGEPERDGVPERPGVMRRLATIEEKQVTIEAELHPNHGSSLRDAVDKAVFTVQRLEERFDAHLKNETF